MKKASVPVGRPSLLRHTNALILLKLLREAGSCSRADLVRASGLSAPTVTNVVSDLLAANLIKPLGEGESSGGRPPDMISFKAERGCLLAVEIKAGFVAFLLTDLRGTELDSAKVLLADKETNPEAICLLIRDEIRRLQKKQRLSREQLLAVVVGVPAITNVDEGVVVSISTLDNWRSVPLRAMLTKLIDCFVLIENDTNLAALGERFRGAARFEETFVSIHIGTNVSAGIVLSGHLHHGAQWSAGEIAYLRLPHISRKYPALHEFGELESILTSSGIVDSWNREYSKRGETSTARKRSRKQTTAQAVLGLAEAGDALARKIIQQRATILSDILVNLSLILNPDLVLLGGEVGSHPVVLSMVKKQLEKSEFGVTRIASATLGDAAALWGAIAVALEKIAALLLPSPAA